MYTVYGCKKLCAITHEAAYTNDLAVLKSNVSGLRDLYENIISMKKADFALLAIQTERAVCQFASNFVASHALKACMLHDRCSPDKA
jgi:hypothetical protein